MLCNESLYQVFHKLAGGIKKIEYHWVKYVAFSQWCTMSHNCTDILSIGFVIRISRNDVRTAFTGHYVVYVKENVYAHAHTQTHVHEGPRVRMYSCTLNGNKHRSVAAASNERLYMIYSHHCMTEASQVVSKTIKPIQLFIDSSAWYAVQWIDSYLVV